MMKNKKINCHLECDEESINRFFASTQNDTLTTQSGRSMVEMLGVLAIIGVLSVAGIAGYNIAMRNHKANEIIQAINKMAIEAQSANGGTGIKADLFYQYTKPSGLVELAASTGGVISVVLEDDIRLCKLIESRFGTSETNPNPIFVKVPCTTGMLKNLKLQIKDAGF